MSKRYLRHPELDSGSYTFVIIMPNSNHLPLQELTGVELSLQAGKMLKQVQHDSFDLPFPSPKGEDRMLNEQERIESILGEGFTCRGGALC